MFYLSVSIAPDNIRRDDQPSITLRPGTVVGSDGRYIPGYRPEDNVGLPGQVTTRPIAGGDYGRGDIPSHGGKIMGYKITNQSNHKHGNTILGGPSYSRISERQYHHSHYTESTQIMTVPSSNHTVINPTNGLTVLIGTGGPKQNVYTTGSRVDTSSVSSSGIASGAAQQTVYSKEGGLTVLIGTGGPHQTVHHIPAGAHAGEHPRGKLN